MRILSKHFLILVLVATILTPPVGALAESHPEGRDPQINMAYMAGDAVLVRPLGIVATVVGFAFFIVASPFALISGNAGETWDGLVVYPAKFTFQRPIGEFN
jgi:hypothetical protein